MSDPQDKPPAENSTPSLSLVGKINAFVSNPNPSGSNPSTWVPVREQVKDEVSRVFANVKGLFRKK